MAQVWLRGPFKLDAKTVQEEVSETSPGAYALGEPAPEFKVRRIGRSDSHVALALSSRTGEYPEFEFAYTPSAKEAFELECELFHDHFRDLDKPRWHPARPAGSGWQCPRCLTFRY